MSSYGEFQKQLYWMGGKEGQKSEDIPGSGNSFKQTKESRCLGDDYVFRGDRHFIITSCYRCDMETVVEAADTFKNLFLFSENRIGSHIYPFHIENKVSFWV